MFFVLGPSWRRRQQVTHQQHKTKTAQNDFVEALRQVPTAPRVTRDSQLRKLAEKYRPLLANCSDDIPYSLERFGIHRAMNFDDFLYWITWDM